MFRTFLIKVMLSVAVAGLPMSAVAAEKTGDGSGDKPAESWNSVPVEKRCEGLWTWLAGSIRKRLPDWTLSPPKCEISGGGSAGISWSVDLHLVKGADKFDVRYQITELSGKMPAVEWCLIKGGKFGCAAPWENSFGRGKLFGDKKAAREAYVALTTRSNGLLETAVNLDAWVSAKAGEPVLYGVPYSSWVQAWVSAKRSLPTTDQPFSAEFKLTQGDGRSGAVRSIEMPKNLRECLKCGKPDCDLSQMTFEFSGNSLAIRRVLTAEDAKLAGQTAASVTWIMMDETPFVKGKPAWPMLCGEHRFNILKL